MRKLLNTKLNKKGFTLAELLIVVAIIAVLVAIAIPIFTTQLEKSRQATDLANIRSSYAEAMAAAIADNDVGVGSEYKVQNSHGKLDLVDISSLTGTLGAFLNADTAVTGTIQVTVNAEGAVQGILKSGS